LAREVRRGRLEIHAWCVLTTHFHLLVRSPRGELSEALRRAQNEYSRHFNRRLRRDGPLIRGRFYSRPVTTITYRLALVRYIDANPVQAGLADHAAHYPFGSALQYSRAAGPPWLERTWVETEVVRVSKRETFRPEDYSLAFPELAPGSTSRSIERRISHGKGSDALDSLVDAAPERVRRWLERKARLADGTVLGLPVCDAETVRATIAEKRLTEECSLTGSRCRLASTWDAVEAALLRDLAGLTWSEIAAACRTSTSTSHARYRVHVRLLTEEPLYADRVSSMAAEVIAFCFPSGRRVRAGAR
jgi:REP element-mobilizing transposase RayT